MAEQIISVELHTDDPRAREIAELYWDHDETNGFSHRVSDIAETYGLQSHEVREIANDASTAILVSETCDGCGEGRRLTSRQDAASRWRGSYRWGGLRLCEDCQRDRTDEESRARNELARQERERIAALYVVPDSPVIEVRSLRLQDAVALLALIRSSADELLTQLRPLTEAPTPWAPGEDYRYELLRAMNGSILWVDPESPVDAFIWEGEHSQFYLDRVAWRVAGPRQELHRIWIELEDLFATKDWPEPWTTQAPALQTALAAHELSDYLVDRLKQHHFDFSPGEKTWDVLTSLAGDLTIGQGYNLIWRAARDAASFYVREGCDRRRAAAYAIGALRRSYERAMSAGWNLDSYGRSWTSTESQITHIFYRLFLGADDPMTAPPANHRRQHERSTDMHLSDSS